MTLIIAGGGTGGHILAGVAIADEWRLRFPQAKIIFVGAQGGIEEKLVPRAGYPLEVLKLGALNRTTLSRKIKTGVQLPLAFLRSLAILMNTRPQAVLGVGGYASGPLILVARLLNACKILNCRTAILEQNSVPGFTNRMLGRWVSTVFCSFPGTETQFPGKTPLITGNPIRSSIRRMPSAPRTPFTIFIFGGSQGALGVNTMVLNALPFLKDVIGQLKFVHQTGEKDFDRVVQEYQNQGVQARIEKFVYNMPETYAESSLLVCRAGASTLSEIASVGRAAILIPLPTAADNHQQKNAEVFVNRDAAWLLPQEKSSGRELAELIRALLANPAPIASIEQKVTQFFKPDAAKDIVQELAHP